MKSACVRADDSLSLCAVPTAADPPSVPVVGTPFLLGMVAVLSLGANVALGWFLWQTQRTQDLRLARLEGKADSEAAAQTEDHGKATLGSHPRRAGLDERLALLLSLAGNPERSRRMLETVSPEENAALAQALLARPPANDRNAALVAVIEAIGRNDPERAASFLDPLQEPVLRARLAANIAETWSGSHPDAAARWLVSDGARFLDPGSAATPLLRALAQWAAFDPEAATKFAADQGQDRGPITRALGLAAQAWGQKSPQEALAWAQTLPATDPRRAVVVPSIWQGWTQQNPTQAAAAVGQQLYSGERIYTELAGTVAKEWAAIDPNASAQWAASLPPGGARRNALYQAAMTWTQIDPAGASRWAGNLPASAVRMEIWREIVATWAESDLDGAGNWLGALPLGHDHDEAVSAYLPKLEPTDPSKALSWAGTISDAGTRGDQVQAILSRWSRRDAAAARNWAAASGVPVPSGRLAP